MIISTSRRVCSAWEGYALRREESTKRSPCSGAPWGIRRRQLDPVSHEVAVTLASLGVLLMRKAEHEEAESLFREAHAINGELFDSQHPEYVAGLNNLGSVLTMQGKFEAAEPLFVEALQVNRTLFGGEHVRVSRAEHNLGAVTKQLGKYEKAIELLSRAVNTHREMLGGHASRGWPVSESSPKLVESLHGSWLVTRSSFLPYLMPSSGS